MKQRSLRFKLMLGGVVLSTLPLTVAALVSMNVSQNALEQAGREQIRHISQNIADMTQLVLSEEVKLAREMASGNTTVDVARQVFLRGVEATGDQVAPLVRKLTNTMSEIGADYETVFVADLSGRIYADGSNGEYIGVSVADRAYFQEARKRQETFVGDPVASRVSEKPVVPICAPVFGPEKEVISVLVSVITTDFWAKTITQNTIGKTGYPYVLDRENVVVIHPDQTLIMSADVDQIEGMETIAARINGREAGIENYVFRGTPKVAGFVPVPINGWTVIATQNRAEFYAAADRIQWILLFFGGAFLLVVLISTLVAAGRISRPILASMGHLRDTAERVAAASAQVSATGQSLAEGASEQAASVEETSASLEQISAMTRQNAQSAEQIQHLRDDAFSALESAATAMNQAAERMTTIRDRGDEISRIVGSIDEISFQTNLLALNAAIEAARAGETGAGFAVVADEVRNLAIRAAQAARDTQDRIETTLRDIHEGAEAVTETRSQFDVTLDRNQKVGDLVNELVASVQEQSAGIQEINRAMAEMDKVVQQNAASAEEAAGAGVEMRGLSDELQRIVHSLSTVVGVSVAENRPSEGISQTTAFRSNKSESRAISGADRTALPAPERTD